LETLTVRQEEVRPNVQVVPFLGFVLNADDVQHDAVVPCVHHRKAVVEAVDGVKFRLRPAETAVLEGGVERAAGREDVEVHLSPGLVVAADAHHRLLAEGYRPLAVDEITAADFKRYVAVLRCRNCCQHDPKSQQKNWLYYIFHFIFIYFFLFGFFSLG